MVRGHRAKQEALGQVRPLVWRLGLRPDQRDAAPLVFNTHLDRQERRVLLFGSEWELQYFHRHHPDVTLLAESPVG